MNAFMYVEPITIQERLNQKIFIFDTFLKRCFLFNNSDVHVSFSHYKSMEL